MANPLEVYFEEWRTWKGIERAAEGDRRTISNFIEYAAINYIFANNTVDDIEMNEILSSEKDLKKGLDDIKKKRYKIIG